MIKQLLETVQFLSTVLVYWEFSRLEILAKMALGRFVKFSPSHIFAILKISMKTYSRVYFSMCLFLVIQGGDKKLSEN